MASKVCQQEVKKKKGIDAKRSDQAGRSIHAKKKNVKYPITFAEFRVSRLLKENSFRFPVLFG